MFTDKDAEVFKALKLKPADLADKSIEDIIKLVNKKLEENETEYKKAVEKRKEDAKRESERTADLEKSKSPKQVKNKISLIRRIFGNIELQDEIEHSEQQEKENDMEYKMIEEVLPISEAPEHDEERSVS